MSGGADSLALLVLACAAGCAVTAVHVDHGLREGTAREADVVRDAADRFGAAFRLVQVEVAPGPNLEARAREARYAALPPGVLTGHTLDDRAETMVLNLLRGAGPDGMAARLEHGARRPLLALRRSETRALCAALGLDPVDDPSNADPRFVRNRVRAEVLPLLDDVAGRDVAALLVRQARAFADDADLLDELAGALDVTDARAVASAPPRSRAVRSGRGCAPPVGACHPTPRRSTGCSPWRGATPWPPRWPAAGGWRGPGARSASSRPRDPHDDAQASCAEPSHARMLRCRRTHHSGARMSSPSPADTSIGPVVVAADALATRVWPSSARASRPTTPTS